MVEVNSPWHLVYSVDCDILLMVEGEGLENKSRVLGSGLERRVVCRWSCSRAVRAGERPVEYKFFIPFSHVWGQ